MGRDKTPVVHSTINKNANENDTIGMRIENEKAYVEESLKLEKYRLEQGLISKQEYVENWRRNVPL